MSTSVARFLEIGRLARSGPAAAGPTAMTAAQRRSATTGQRVLVIEDEPDIADLLVYNLEREGYLVTSIDDGGEGLDAARRDVPDLVLLDLMLPGMDGLEVCRGLRAEPRTAAIPVIMVTAKGEESDVVLGLGIGADDYIAKPFSPRELIARVKAVLRRHRSREADAASERIERDGLVVDAGRHEVTVDGERRDFTATEFRLLHFLAGHPGRVYTRDQIIARVIGDAAIIIDRNIDVHIRAIRKKLGRHRDLIETVRGVGYRFRDDG